MYHFSPMALVAARSLAMCSAAGDLAGLAEDAVNALRDQLVVHVADGRAGAEAGGGVALAAFRRDPQIGDAAFFLFQLGCPVQEFLGLVGGLGDGGDVAVALDAEADHGLAGFRDALDHAVGPAVLDADHHDGCDVRVAAGADQGAEMQIEVGAELQAAVGVRDRQRALDVVGDRLAGRIREIVERQDDDMIAHADALVLAPPAPEREVRCDGCDFADFFDAMGLRLTSAWFCDCGCGRARRSWRHQSCGRRRHHT